MTNETSERFDIAVYDYLRQPYARLIVPEDDGSFRGEILEFPGCIATGDDPFSTLDSLEGVARAWLSAVLENGQAVPTPIDLDSDYSGKLALRIPRSLHKKAALYAEREGVSLNQFISYSLAEAVGERRVQRMIYVSISTAGSVFKTLSTAAGLLPAVSTNLPLAQLASSGA